MSILDRLHLLIRSNVSDIGSGLKGRVSEIDESMRDARLQRAELRRGESSIVQQIRDAREETDRWEKRAMLALKNGDEALAREALLRKNRVVDQIESLRGELDEHRAYQQDITKALEALELKMESTQGRLRAASGGTKDNRSEDEWDREMQRRMLDQSERPSGRASTPQQDRAFDEFERMAGKVEALEADTQAEQELHGDGWKDPRRRELESIFERMERDQGVRDDLEDLKRKFSD